MGSEADSSPFWIVCLCADWCGVCREWRETFTAEAARHPDLKFAWVDVEEEDEAMGEIDIETFPTVLAAHGSEVLFLGPMVPTGGQFARHVAAWKANPVPAPGLGDQASALLQRLAPAILPRHRVRTR